MDAKTIFELTGAFGFSVIIGGGLVYLLSGWLGKLWASRILEEDRAKYSKELEALRQTGEVFLGKLRTQSEKELWVHRLQFEKEFKIYLELWASLVHLTAALSQLKPGLAIVDPNEIPKECEPSNVDRLKTAIRELATVVHEHRPFYAPEVFQAATKVIHIADIEHMKHLLDLNDDRQTTARIREAVRLAYRVCEEIRGRIWSVNAMGYEANQEGADTEGGG